MPGRQACLFLARTVFRHLSFETYPWWAWSITRPSSLLTIIPEENSRPKYNYFFTHRCILTIISPSHRMKKVLNTDKLPTGHLAHVLSGQQDLPEGFIIHQRTFKSICWFAKNILTFETLAGRMHPRCPKEKGAIIQFVTKSSFDIVIHLLEI